MKKYRLMILVSSIVFLLAGCNGNTTATAEPTTTQVNVVEATPPETHTANPTDAPVSATPTEDVAAPTEAEQSSNLGWEVVDFAYDGNLNILGTFHDGDTVEATKDDHYDCLIFGMKTEKVIEKVELTSKDNNFGLESELFSEKKISVPLRNGIAYDNYEAKTKITYVDGTTDEITIYITIPDGVY